MYPMHKYDGLPEFELFNRENFNVQRDEDLPTITFMSNTRLNELAPQPSETPLEYQEYHPFLEDWAVFRLLPQVMHYDKKMNEFFKGINAGTYRIPDYINNVNPPSLFAYHSTLPSMFRNHSMVTNMLYAMEFHQPKTEFRDKELALNYMASFLRPIDERLLAVIKIMASAQKVRLNMELGKQMMNELKFWQLDTHEVGTESDEEGMDEEDITQLIGKGIDADGNEEGHSDLTMAERMIAAFEDEGIREKEREELVTKELNISRFQVEPEVE